MTTVSKRKPSHSERLLSKAVIDWDTSCWDWTGSKDYNGYGKVRINGRSAMAHRVAYELIEGPIPKGLQLDHLCRNRACINPAHLEPVTREENMRRAQTAHTHCVAGHSYEPGNTYWSGNRRRCRICTNASNRRSYARLMNAGQEAAA